MGEKAFLFTGESSILFTLSDESGVEDTNLFPSLGPISAAKAFYPREWEHFFTYQESERFEWNRKQKKNNDAFLKIGF